MSVTGEIAYRVASATRRPASWLQLIQFGIVGVSGYLVNLATFAVLAGSLGIHYLIAAVGAFCVAVNSNLLWHRHWVFGSSRHVVFRTARYFAVSLMALFINLVVLKVLVSGNGMDALAAQAVAVAVAMPFNLAGNRLWTLA